jgi:hypothetical protein
VIVEIMVTTFVCVLAFVWLQVLSYRRKGSDGPIDSGETTPFAGSTNSGDEENIHSAATTNARYVFSSFKFTVPARYLAVYIICWFPRLIFEFENIFGIDSSWFLKILAQFMLSSIGFWNAVVYGTMPPEYQFQRLWFHAIGGLWRLTQKIAPTETAKEIAEVEEMR